jgi:hypothetical protein
MPTLPPDVEAMSKAKGEIGTRVHALIEDYLQAKPLFYSPQSREEAYFESWRMWYDKKAPEIIMKEKRLFCDELMITGQVDAVMSFDGMPVLVDYKTSSAEGKLADGSSSWAMQAHFYYYLLTQNFVQVSDKMLFLQLRDQKDITLISNGCNSKIRPSELSQMIKDFDDDDKALINEKLKTVGEFEFDNGLGKSKIIVSYTPKIAKIYEYNFDENMLSRCIEQAKLAWLEISEK